MSQENVEVMRQMLDAVNRGDSPHSRYHPVGRAGKPGRR
jgi:hypothetical protein